MYIQTQSKTIQGSKEIQSGSLFPLHLTHVGAPHEYMPGIRFTEVTPHLVTLFLELLKLLVKGDAFITYLIL